VVGSVSPSSGSAGIQVTINGSNFGGSPQVWFGNNQASGVSVNSTSQPSSGVTASSAGTQIVVTVPAGTGTVPVWVQGPGGRNTSGPSFTYVGPGIATLDTLFGPIGGGTVVHIAGSNFTGANLMGPGGVEFGKGHPAQSFTVVDDSHITAVSPAYYGIQEVDVFVTTPVGSSQAAPNDQQFDYGPGITGASGTSGPAGTPVTINGINFTGATGVNFGNTPAKSFTVNSDTQITAVAPAPSGSNVDLQVLNLAGHSDCCVASFTYPRPIIALSPSSGPPGTPVTISGSGLTGGTVRWGSTTIGSPSASDNSINVTAPPGSGSVQVTVSSPAGTSNAVTYTYPVPPPTIATIMPATGPALGGTAVTITGTNLAGSTCTIGGTAVACAATAGSVMFLTPAHAAGAVSVVVTTPTGFASTTFTYV